MEVSEVSEDADTPDSCDVRRLRPSEDGRGFWSASWAVHRFHYLAEPGVVHAVNHPVSLIDYLEGTKYTDETQWMVYSRFMFFTSDLLQLCRF